MWAEKDRGQFGSGSMHEREIARALRGPSVGALVGLTLPLTLILRRCDAKESHGLTCIFRGLLWSQAWEVALEGYS